jgi:hypothetical protein
MSSGALTSLELTLGYVKRIFDDISPLQPSSGPLRIFPEISVQSIKRRLSALDSCDLNPLLHAVIENQPGGRCYRRAP